MHPSIVNLSSRLHLCSGDVPPPLVGASTTLVEPLPDAEDRTTRLYLFGGRLVSNRKMINHLYCLELEKMNWFRIGPSPTSEGSSATRDGSDNQPQPRYFHSADLWRDKIVFFGGMGYSDRPAAADPSAPRGPSEVRADDLCVLDEVIAFDLATQTWDLSFSASSSQPDRAGSSAQASAASRPAPRYAHLSSVSDDCLIVVGGQNITNQYVESINVFSLAQRRWVSAQRFQRQCGSYRSLAVAARYNLAEGERAKCYPRGRDPLGGRTNEDAATIKTDSVAAGTEEKGKPAQMDGPTAKGGASVAASSSSSLVQVELNPLPHSAIPTSVDPQPVYVYSNYNFTDVRRELEVLRIKPEILAASDRRTVRRGSNASEESAIDVEMPISPTRVDAEASTSSSSPGDLISIEEKSYCMTGTTLPPGLRFPTGAILGAHLIISGTYLANATQTFSLWALHLPTMAWSRLEAGSHLSSGSWNRAILWPGKNRIIVVGHKERDLVSDYNHRQTNWNHVVVLELEAWGIYQPPVPRLSQGAVRLGLNKLAASAASAMTVNAGFRGIDGGVGQPQQESNGPEALEKGNTANEPKVQPPLLPEVLGGRGDFEIVCSDGVRLGCDRAILECRWPWFKDKMDDFRKRSRRTARIASGAQQDSKSLALIPEELSDILSVEDPVEELAEVTGPAAARDALESNPATRRANDPRFQPRHLQLSEPSVIVMAFLQFLYTEQVCTALQRHPAVVCALMVLSKTYKMDGLLTWAKHAAHVALADDLNPKSPNAGPRGGGLLSSSSAMQETSGFELFRPADSLGLHPEERHRLAVCLYEAASLCGCEGLQVRALRVVMSVARWLQKHSGNGGGSSGGLGNDRSGAPPDGGPASRSASFSGPGSGFSGSSAQNESSNAYNYSQRGAGNGHQLAPQASFSRRGSAAKFDNAALAAARPSGMVSPLSSGESSRVSTARHASASGSRSDSRATALDLVALGIGRDNSDGRAVSPKQTYPTGLAPLPSTEEGSREFAHVPGVGYDRYSTAEEDLLDAFGLVSSTNVQPKNGRRLDISLSRSGSCTRGGSSLAAQSPDAETDSSTRSFLAMRSGSFQNTSSPSSISFSRRNTGTSVSSAASGSQLSLSQSSVADQAGARTPLTPSLDTELVLNKDVAKGAGPTEPVAASLDSPTNHGLSASLASRHPHLSAKELKKLEKEERKLLEKEQKERKKAEKAERKRLAADAVFGPKGGSGLPSSLYGDSTSGFAASNGSTLMADSAGAAEGTASRTSSIRSGTSTASPRSASLKTNKSPRSPLTPNAEWSITTVDTSGGWFAGGPSPFLQSSLQSAAYKSASQSARSISSFGRQAQRSRA